MDIELLPHQEDFLLDNHQQCLLAGGIGSAKTTAGTFFTLKMVSENPSSPGLITANTFTQLQSATLSSLSYWCDYLSIPFSINFNKKIATVNGTPIMFRSAEKYDNCRGIEAGWWWGDESAFYSEDAYKVFLGRLRAKNSPLIGRFTTTPYGYNWLYHLFHKNGDNHDSKRYHLIHAHTSQNSFLDPEYIKMLENTYSAAYIRQELLGEFVSLGGMRVYFDFDRNKHLKPCRDLFSNSQSQQLYVFIDYNLDPFCGVVGFVQGGILYIIDEIYLEGGADVRKMGNTIISKWGQANPIVVGDGTGNNKRDILNINMTAYKQLKELGLRVEQFSNPHVVKRTANFNGCLYQGKIVIEPSLKKLIRDLESVGYKKNTQEIDKDSDKTLTHISDAASYMVYKLLPPPSLTPKTSHHLF